MSWNAKRHCKRVEGCPGSLAKNRIDDQRVIARLLDGNVLFGIFGITSVECALRVALRIKRMKQRVPDALSLIHTNSHMPYRRHLRGRNNHHLTPRSRKDQPYYGDTPHNLLLMKVKRHDALHKECELRTWEEIIFLLARCVKKLRGMSFYLPADHVSPSSRRSKNRRHTTRYHSHARARNYSFSPG